MAKRILVIDDQPDFLDIFSKKLQSEGYEVNTANGAINGLEQVKATKPDLVLMDVNMPGMNGAEALAAMKADPETANIKVVFLTNLGNMKDAEQGLNEQFAKEIGAAGYIQKTSDINSIVKDVGQYIS